LDWESIRRTWVWHLTYLSNIYFALRGEYEGPISPLWSLSVEEQFYLIWPLVVLNLPRKYLPHAATALIGCALLWRVGVLYEGTRSLFTYVLPFNLLDGLGFGALLSITAQNTGVETHPLSSAGKVVGLPIFVLLLGATLLDRAVALSSILLEFVASLFFTFLVAQASVGFKGLIGRVLNYAALVYLGRISYGLYLYHAFVPDAFKWAMHRVGIPLTAWDVPAPLFEAVQSLSAVYASRVTALIMVVIYSSIAIGIASISWFLWERPLNALRQYVRYPGLSRVAPPASFQRAS
jgi:peptidoglycan/LPS O-acetylase OafA/YrhL